MELENQISEAIAKNLPAQVGEVLRKRLEQAETDAADVVSMHKRNSELITANAQLKAEIARQSVELGAHAGLKKREDDVSKREHDADVAELRVKLEAAQQSTQFAKEVAMGLVRNTEFRRNVFESGSTPVVQQQPGGFSTVMPHSISSSTTTTDELK